MSPASDTAVRPALRHLLESHVSLQPRLRALLSRRWRHAQVGTENFADRSELGTEECFKVIDDIAAFAPECLTILTGGEPLLRRDILEIVRRAADRGLWVVVGTNGVRISENVAQRLAEAGARGLSLSLDALDPDRHDRFRKVRGAWQNTVEGAEILNRTGLPFIVQTTAGSHNLGELEAIADFAHDRLAAKVWNLYFLVPTGRGQFVSDMTPAQYDEVLAALYLIQRKYEGRMLVNAKCAPHYIKTVLEHGDGADPGPADGDSSPIRTYSGGAGGCPAGTHYMGIRPNGDVTPCPYLPVFAGSFAAQPRGSLDLLGPVHRHPPAHVARGPLWGVRDERALRRLPRQGLWDDRRCDGRRSALHPYPGEVRGSPLLALARQRRSASAAPGVRDRVRRRIADDDRVGRCGRRADEEDPRVRPGMVVRAVEDSCRKNGISRVTVEELERIRARMPTPKMFG